MAIGINNMNFTAIVDMFAKLRRTSFFEALNCGIQDNTTKTSSCTNYFVKETNDRGLKWLWGNDFTSKVDGSHKLRGKPYTKRSLNGRKSKLGFYVPFNSQGHIGTGPQNCHLWDSNPQR